MTHRTEQWRPIPGWEDRYHASNHGHIKSLARVIQYQDGRHRPVGDTVLKQKYAASGHHQVSFWASNKTTTKWVHRLVAETFLGPCPDGMEVRHLNGDPADNRVENLAYGSRRENMLDRSAHGVSPQRNKTHCPQGHRLDAPNLTAWSVKQGHRNCLACSRARAALQHNPGLGDLQTVADGKYAAIMGRVTTGT